MAAPAARIRAAERPPPVRDCGRSRAAARDGVARNRVCSHAQPIVGQDVCMCNGEQPPAATSTIVSVLGEARKGRSSRGLAVPGGRHHAAAWPHPPRAARRVHSASETRIAIGVRINHKTGGRDDERDRVRGERRGRRPRGSAARADRGATMIATFMHRGHHGVAPTPGRARPPGRGLRRGGWGLCAPGVKDVNRVKGARLAAAPGSRRECGEREHDGHLERGRRRSAGDGGRCGPPSAHRSATSRSTARGGRGA